MIHTNEQMVSELINKKVLKSKRIIKAFLEIDRKLFLPRDVLSMAYQDVPLPIGYSQTNSQPQTVAFMLEMLNPSLGDTVLDLGSGSGWTSALLGHIVGKNGKVYGIERIKILKSIGSNNVAKTNLFNVKILLADDKIGFLKKAPYDKILVSASAPFLPKELAEQLKLEGRMIIPINDSIYKIDKDKNNHLSITSFQGFNFVPLILK